jgi:hypothetical protein
MAHPNSTLLSLPMELLQRITDRVTPDALLQARLACKTLDAASVDRFTDTYARDIPVWMYDHTRWTHLKALLSMPRLAPRVKSVVFLSTYPGFYNVHELPSARNETDSDLLIAQYGYVQAIEKELWELPLPGYELILSIIACLASAHPDVCLALLCVAAKRRLRNGVHGLVYAAILSTNARLETIDINFAGLSAMLESNTWSKSDLLKVGKHLQRIKYVFGNQAYGRTSELKLSQDLQSQASVHRAIISLLSAMKEVKHLAIDGWHCYPTSGQDHDHDHSETLASTLLLANPLSGLQSLHLSEVATRETPLLEVLLRCTRSLRSLMFETVCITSLAGWGWESVLRCISDMHDVYERSAATGSAKSKLSNRNSPCGGAYVLLTEHETIFRDITRWLQEGLVLVTVMEEEEDDDEDEEDVDDEEEVEEEEEDLSDMTSGSEREGFEISDEDRDLMFQQYNADMHEKNI